MDCRGVRLPFLLSSQCLVSTVSLLDYTNEDFLGYQILSLSIATTGLILGAVVTERQRAERTFGSRGGYERFSRVTRITTAGALGASVVHEISQASCHRGDLHPMFVVACCGPEPIDLKLLERTMISAESEVRRAGEIVGRLRNFFGQDRGFNGLSLI